MAKIVNKLTYNPENGGNKMNFSMKQHNFVKKFIASFVIALLLLILFMFTNKVVLVNALEDPIETWDISATEDDSVIAKLSQVDEDSYSLEITGTGNMMNFQSSTSSSSCAPWRVDAYLSKIETITIGDGITNIGNYAFYGCTDISTITIPDGVTNIGSNALGNCSNLKTVVIPNSVETIGSLAFYNVPLENVTIPSTFISSLNNKTNLINVTITSGTSIPASAFSGCKNLVNVSLPDSITSIGNQAFYNCSSIEEITIPDSVTTIGQNIFYGCHIKRATIPANICKYINNSSLEEVEITSGTTIENSAFSGCINLVSVTICSSVTSIESNAFKNCSSLHSITIPSNVESIGINAFMGCFNIETIIVEEGNTNYHTINNCLIDTNNKSLILGLNNSIIPTDGSVTGIGENAFYGCTELTNIVIPDTITSIGNSAFYNCTNLENIMIPNSVTSLGASVFYNCTKLTNITLSNELKVISSSLFYNCNSLTSIVIPNSITSLGTNVFYNCTQLSNVILSNQLETINSGLFYNCRSLNSIIIPDGVTSIGTSAFANCINLTTVSLPNSLSEIKSNAFNGCEKLEYSEYDNALYLGNDENPYVALFKVINRNVNTININSATRILYFNSLENCSNLTSINIPKSVVYIEAGVFGSCQFLDTITVEEENSKYQSINNCLIDINEKVLMLGCKSSVIPSDGSVTSIGYKAFYDCKGLTEIELPNTITSIGNQAFLYCRDLKNIVIPTSVTKIEANAFANCTSLTRITIPNSVTIIAAQAFYGCTGLTEVTLPNNITTIQGQLFCNCENLESIVIPSSVTGIGANAFANCTGLTSITIPNNVTTIEGQAFYNCSNLKTIIISRSAISIASNAFSGCMVENATIQINALSSIRNNDLNNSLTNIILTSGTEIPSNVFSSFRNLSTITIPSTVTSIKSNAFYGCKSLNRINISSLQAWFNINFATDSNPLRIAKELYLNGELVTDIVVPSNITTIKAYVLQGYHLNSLTISNSVGAINAYAFYNCQIDNITIPNKTITTYQNAFQNCRIENATIPGNVLSFITTTNLVSVTINGGSIPANAFNGCGRLKDVTISDYVTSIGKNAFSGCSGLTEITIPESITTISPGAFSNCINLVSVTLPSRLNGIYASVFENCYRLRYIEIPNSIQEIGSRAFYNCSSLTQIYIPEGVRTIGDQAFGYCQGIQDIVIPNSVTSISSNAFVNCKIKTASLPANAIQVLSTASSILSYYNNNDLVSVDVTSGTSLPTNAFSNCTKLTHVTLASTITSVGDNAFKGCYIEYVTAPMAAISKMNGFYFKEVNINGGSSIPSNAFIYCSKLEKVTMADSITSIGSYAFASCSNLTMLKLSTNITSIGDDAFRYCKKLDSLILPSTLTTIGPNAFLSCNSIEELFVNCNYNDTIYTAIEKVIDNKNFTLYYHEDATGWESVSCNKRVLIEVISNDDYYISKTLTGLKYQKLGKAFIINGFIRPDDSQTAFDIDIPDYVLFDNNIYPAREIADSAFYRMSYIKNVSFGKNITTIGKYAFSHTGITKVEIPSNVIHIGEEAFSENSTLENVIIGNGVIEIEDKAFYGTNITRVSLGNSVETIGDEVFAECSNLRWVVFVGEVPTIGMNAISINDDGIKTSIYYNYEALSWNQNAGNSIVGYDRSSGWVTAYERACKINANPTYECDFEVVNHGELVYLNERKSDFYGNSYDFLNDEATLVSADIESSVFGGDIAIPNYVFFANNIYPVTGIGEGVFSNTSLLNSIQINDLIKTIGANAFSGCSNLQEVIIGDGVTTIGSSAFSRCSKLTSVVIGKSIQSVGSNAFYSDKNLKYVTFNSALVDYIGTDLQNSALSNLGNLTIESCVFAGCSGLEELMFIGNKPVVADDVFGPTIPTNCVIVRLDIVSGWSSSLMGLPVYSCSTTTLDELGWKDNQGVYYSTYPDTNYAIVGYKVSTTREEENRWSYDEENGEYVYSDTSLSFDDLNGLNASGTGYYGTGAVTIADYVYIDGKMHRVVGLDIYAFFGSKVRSITMGKFIGSTEITGIPNTSLRHTDLLQSIYVDRNNSTYMTVDGILYTNMKEVGEIRVPTMLMKLPSAKYLSNGILSLNDDDTQYVTAIDYYACSNNVSLKQVDLYRVQHIYAFAFSDCISLSSVNFGNNKYIGDGAFYNCSNLSSIALPTYTETIGAKAFYNCIKLSEVTILGDIGLIGDSAFGYCNNITSFTVENSNRYFSNDGVLYRKEFEDEEETVVSEIHLMQYPSSSSKIMFTPYYGTTHIDSYAFYYAQNIQNIILCDSVLYIGDHGFDHCTALKSIKIGPNIKPISIGGAQTRMFVDCLSLKEFIVDSENQYYLSDGGVLYQYKYDVELNESGELVTSIDNNSLLLIAYPAGLQRANYTIPENVVYIASGAFYNNPYIQRIVLMCDNVEIMDEVFAGCISLSQVVFKCEVPSQVGEAVFPKTNDGHQSCEILYHESKSSWKDKIVGNDEAGYIWIANSNNRYTISEYNAISELTNLEGEDKNYILVVVDSKGRPINGATVEIDGTRFANYLTNTNGSYAFEYESEWLINASEYMNGNNNYRSGVNVKITKEGYYPYDNFLYLDPIMRITYITLVKESTVKGISIGNHDINSEMVTINIRNYKDTDRVSIVVEGYSDVQSGQYISYFAIVQDGQIIEEIRNIAGGFNYNTTDGVARIRINVELGKFIKDVPVQVLMKVQEYDVENHAVREVGQLKANLFLKIIDFKVNENGFKTITTLLGFDVPEWVPFLGDSKMNLEIPQIPVQIKVKGDTATIALNTEIKMNPDDLKDMDVSISEKLLEDWDDYKQVFKNIKEANKLKDKRVKGEYKKKNELKLEVCGAVELKYIDGGIKVTRGYIQGTLEYKFSLGTTMIVWVIPVRLELEVSAKGEMKLVLYEMSYDEEVNFFNQMPKYELDIKIEATGRAGVGCSIVSVGFYGKIGIKIKCEFCPKYELEKVSLIGDLGIYFKYKGIFFKYYQEWSLFKTLANAGIMSYNGEWVIYEKEDDEGDGIVATTNSLNGALRALDAIEAQENEMMLMQNYVLAAASELPNDVYQNIEPTIVLDKNGHIIMMYADNVLNYSTICNYDEYNYQKLVYKIYKQDIKGRWYWTEPKLVCDNGYADSEYELIAVDGEVYLVYTQSKDLILQVDKDDVSKCLSGLEVWYSHFDYETESFKGSLRLTNDDYYDSNLCLVKDGDNIIISWTKNTENSLYGTSIYNYTYSPSGSDDDFASELVIYDTTANSICIAKVSGEEIVESKTLVSGLGPVVDSIISGDYVYYIVDTDCNLKTLSDRCLYKAIVSAQGVSLLVFEEYECVELACFNHKTYVLVNNEWINVTNKDDTLLGKQEYNISSNARYVEVEGSNGIDAVYLFISEINWFEEENGDNVEKSGSIIWAIPCTDGVWSSPVKLFQERANTFIENFDALWFNDELYITWLENNATTGENITNNYHFEFSNYDVRNDVSLDYVEIGKDDLDNDCLLISITNNSIIPVNSINIEITTPAGTTINDEVNVAILGGSTVKVAYPYDFSSVIEGSYTVRIYVDGEEEQEDNNACVTLAYTDLYVHGKHIYIGEQSTLLVAVSNYGYLKTSGTLYVFAGSINDDDLDLNSALYKLRFDEISRTNTKYFTIILDSDFYKEYVDTGIISLYVKADKDEDNLNGNSFAIVVKEASQDDINVDELKSTFALAKYDYDVDMDNLDDILINVIVDNSQIITIKHGENILSDSVHYVIETNDGNKVIKLLPAYLETLSIGINNFEVTFGDITRNITINTFHSKYNITFVVDGVRSDSIYNIGDTPAYIGDLDSTVTDEYVREFVGWSLTEEGSVDYTELPKVNSNVTYYAVFTNTPKTFTITWVVDGRVSNETYEYGMMPHFNGNLSKANSGHYSYTFIGWNDDNQIVPVTEDKVYTARFREDLFVFTIRFVDYNDEIIATQEYEYGTMVNAPEDPIRIGDDTYYYVFTGWDKEIASCTENATYKATYEQRFVDYVVKFVNYDESIISEETYHYGDEVVIPTNPTFSDSSIGTFVFDKWDQDIELCTKNITYKATYVITYEEYVVTFVDYDGEVLLQTRYHFGDEIVTPTTPVRESSLMNSFTFSGWDKDIVPCSGNTTYTATYEATPIDYTVTFKNYDGSVLTTRTYHYGDNVVAPDVPSREANETYTYTFAAWDKEVAPCTGNITYTAYFIQNYIDYTVVFKNYDGSIISSTTYHYGNQVVLPSTPTKEADNTYTYSFKSWDNDVIACCGDATYQATFTASYIDYLVVFKNDNETVLKSTTYHYGDQVIEPETPVKASDNTYTYSFKSWDSDVIACSGNATYKATYDQRYIDYIVTFLNYDGSVLTSTTYHYGDQVIEPETPIRVSDNTYTYSFKSWDKEITNCMGNTTYSASYTSQYIDYEVVFKNYDGTVISTANYHYGDSVVVPATPSRSSNETYTYSFKSWDKDVVSCNGNVVYTAVFDEVYIEYEVVFKYSDGREIFKTYYHYGDRIIKPTNVTKEDDEDYSYIFYDWDNGLDICTSNMVFVAKFAANPHKKVNIEKVDEFKSAVLDAKTSKSFEDIKRAIELYNALSDDDKEASAEKYEDLKAFALEYNEAVEEFNNSYNTTVETTLKIIAAWSALTLMVGCALALLKSLIRRGE